VRSLQQRRTLEARQERMHTQMTPSIAVLGSISMDLVVEADRLPRPGETIAGKSFGRYPGGKGANQAVAAARLGVSVSFFGKVGEDSFGHELLESLLLSSVDYSDVEKQTDLPTGTASIVVIEGGENAIVYVPGANALVDRPYVDRVMPRLLRARVLLLQLETPLETVLHVLEQLEPGRPVVVLDPAPAMDISALPLHRIDILTPNSGELQELTREHNVERAARQLLATGVKHIVCKDGANGAYVFSNKGNQHCRAFPVEVVDTTAAGDAFNGGLAVSLASGKSLLESIAVANAAGALATMRTGAQPSLPTMAEVETLLG